MSETDLRAQETPPPPAEPESDALAFNHKAGQIQKLKGTTKFDAAVSPEGPAAIGPLPIVASSVLAFTEKVTVDGTTLYRARFSGFSESNDAANACKLLKKGGMNCFASRG